LAAGTISISQADFKAVLWFSGEILVVVSASAETRAWDVAFRLYAPGRQVAVSPRYPQVAPKGRCELARPVVSLLLGESSQRTGLDLRILT